MKAKFNSKELAEKLGIAAQAAAAKAPSVGGELWTAVRIKVGEGMAELTGADYDWIITAKVPCETIETGTAAVPARLFNNFMPFCKSERVTLETNKEKLRIRCGQFYMDLACFPGGGFPEERKEEARQKIVVPAKRLKEVIEAIIHCASTEDGRPAMKGVSLCADKKESGQSALKWISADGFRLGVASLATDIPKELESLTALLPAKVLEKMASILEGEDPVCISKLDGGKVRFEFKDVTIGISEIDGKFPVTDTKEFLRDIRKETTIAGFAIPSILEGIQLGRVLGKFGVFEISAAESGKSSVKLVMKDDGNTNSGETKIEASVKGAELSFKVNLDYLKEIVDGIKGLGYGSILIGGMESTKSFMIAPAVTKDDAGKPGVWYAVMPMILPREEEKKKEEKKTEPMKIDAMPVAAVAVAAA